VAMKIIVIWDVAPCSLVDFYRSFGRTWGLCFLDRRIQRKIDTNPESTSYKNSANIHHTIRRHIPNCSTRLRFI
jgi:hypothetical protein